MIAVGLGTLSELSDRGELCLSIRINIQIQMPHRGNAFLGTFPSAGAKRIGRNIDVGSRRILVCEPAQITRCDGMFQQYDSLRDAQLVCPGVVSIRR